MAGYIGSKAVNLSTTGADINGNANIDGDLSFRDNDKAIFGAGSDLQIYHDPSGPSSLISDQGAGDLILRGSNQIRFQDATGAEHYAIFNENGAVQLYYDQGTYSDPKLATTSTGVDVTGVLSSDGLTVDGVADVNANNINYTGPSPKINIYENDTTDLNTQLIQTGGDLLVRTLSDDASSADARIRVDHSTGDISFYEDTGTTPKFFWDASAESLGIGTGEVLQSKLHVFSGDSGASVNSAANELFVEDSGDAGITIGSGNASSGSLRFADDGGTGRGIVYYDHSTDALSLHADGSERFKVDATGATVTSGTLTATALNLTRITDLTLSSTPALVIGPADGANIAMDTNEISARNNGAGAELLLNQDAGQGAVRVNGTLYLTGTSVSTTDSTLDLSVDSDGSGSNQQIRFLEGGVVRMVMEDNDLYVHDNINAGRVYESGGYNLVYETGSSHVSAYASDVSDGSGTAYRTFIQAYNSVDPDLALFQAFSKDVMADTGATTHNEKSTAHLLDNSGRVWSWSSQYTGRVRVGSTATTTAYRAGDNAFTAYSGTGNAHGHTTYAGYTQIIGRESANTDDVFAVYSAGQMRIEFDAIGNGYFDGGADLGNADYAEYFEWADGNPDNEDRRGYSVVLTTDGKIRIATSEDDTADFLGIVSVEAAIVGDSAWAAWTGKYERDRFGQKVYEDYELLCWGPYDEDAKSYKTQTTLQAMIDAGREADIPEDAITVTKRRLKLSANYDPDRDYTARKDRIEWQAIGLMGKLPLLKGQPTAPQWRKLFDLNDEVEMWLVR